nr:50S ribosomal protein L32 [Chlamydia pecorum]
MAVPRNRHSNARKNIRRSHLAKKPRHAAICSNCKHAVFTSYDMLFLRVL